MGGCHLYLAANFHCPSAGQERQTLVMEDVEGFGLFSLKVYFWEKRQTCQAGGEKKRR
uniref:Unclassified n=1 Tax=Fusarium clavum TaxID=2594811 RepID=W1I9U6_9HYPO|nr:unclassified [Fusarium clavum]CEF82634.1 unclassified [Fusarium clavum]